MTGRSIVATPLTPEGFAPFGDVLDCGGTADKLINQGLCQRFHDRALLDFSPDGRAGISLFHAEARRLPLSLDLVERHPEGSQAFLPMHAQPWLVITAAAGDTPGEVSAFVAGPHQGINFHRGVWHGVLTPLHDPGIFAVVDWIGEAPNLQEYHFVQPPMITL